SVWSSNNFRWLRQILTLIHQACQNNKCGYEVVELLVNKGVDVNKADEDGQSQLHYALSNRNCGKKIVNLLISRGLDINLVDEHNRTLLHYACEKYTEDTVRLLLDRGAKMNVVDV